MKQFLLTTTCCVLLAAAVGCDRNGGRFDTPDRKEVGLTLVLPGIEGRGYLNRGIRDGLAEGGVPTAISIYDWTLGPAGLLINQLSEARARRKGEDLAGYIMAYRTLHPDKPVYLVGHSGGCAVAVFAAESMPPGEGLDGVVLLGPSISPEYNLANALAHIDGQLVSYYSSRDSGFLGVGTTIFGTLDREHSSSAGRVGFRMPASISADGQQQYSRLKQIHWDPSMSLSGNDGGHTDWADSRFVRDYVAPRLRRDIRLLAENGGRRPGQVAPPPQASDNAAEPPPLPASTAGPMGMRPLPGATQPPPVQPTTPLSTPGTTEPEEESAPTTQPTEKWRTYNPYRNLKTPAER